MKSAWATIFFWATATASARRCNGAPTKTPVFRAPVRRRFMLPVILDPEYHYEAVNVEASSATRIRCFGGRDACWPCASAGRFSARARSNSCSPENRKVLAFIRRYEGETVLVVANLSRFPAAGRTGSRAFQGACAGRTVRPHGISRHRHRALSAHPESACGVLVFHRARRGAERADLSPRALQGR